MPMSLVWRKNGKVCWTSELAYIIGLIASDGYLAKQTNRIGIVSKDLEIIDIFRNVLIINNKMMIKARGGEKEKKYMYLEWKDKNFYNFLLAIGLTPAKSKTIQRVDIPDKFFKDFLRGFFDGDGTFWTAWDRRWPNSFVFHIALYSGSRVFMEWMRQKLTTLYGVKGYIKRGAGVFEVRYAKGDSRKLFETMYYQKDLLFLSRKYLKIKEALAFDQKIH